MEFAGCRDGSSKGIEALSIKALRSSVSHLSRAKAQERGIVWARKHECKKRKMKKKKKKKKKKEKKKKMEGKMK